MFDVRSLVAEWETVWAKRSASMRIPEQRDFDTYRRQLVASDLSALGRAAGKTERSHGDGCLMDSFLVNSCSAVGWCRWVFSGLMC